MSGIAISYRRSDSSAIAGRIFDRLALRYGKPAVFMDIEAIPLGIDFRTHIQSVLAEADLLLVVIGMHWAGAGASAGPARIWEDADPVRDEIEAALEHKMPLIPVLVDGARMPGKADLPASLEKLAFLNATEVKTGPDFNAHMDRLIAAIDGILREDPSYPQVPRLPAPTAAARHEHHEHHEHRPAGSRPGSRPGSWSSELMLYLGVPLVMLLVAHHLIVNSLDLNPQYLRVISFAVPLLFGFLRTWRCRRGTASAFAVAVALGLIAVAGMTISEGLNSGQPILPETRTEWRENIEYAITIALAFMVGHALAVGLEAVMRRKFRAVKSTGAHGHRP
jgi:hypothetical protein